MGISHIWRLAMNGWVEILEIVYRSCICTRKLTKSIRALLSKVNRIFGNLKIFYAKHLDNAVMKPYTKWEDHGRTGWWEMAHSRKCRDNNKGQNQEKISFWTGKTPFSKCHKNRKKRNFDKRSTVSCSWKTGCSIEPKSEASKSRETCFLRAWNQPPSDQYL